MADAPLKFREIEKADNDYWQQVAYKAGRKHRGEPSRTVLVTEHGADQAYVNRNWNKLSRAWAAGATPKPNPRPKPKMGLGFSK